MRGLDTPESILGKCEAIAKAGYGFVIRYISPNTANFPHKRCTLAEVQEAHKAGLLVGFVWETVPTSATFFTPAVGRSNGQQGCEVLQGLGVPKGKRIGWACDYDASVGDVHGPVELYGEAFHQACDVAGYLVIEYGSKMAIDYAKARGIIHEGWLAQSKGWSGSRNATADIVQGPSLTVVGLDVDIDEAQDSIAQEIFFGPSEAA